MKISNRILVLLLSLAAGTLLFGQKDAELEALAKQILGTVSELRGLELLREVPKDVLSREQIEEAFRQRIQEDYEPDQLEKERRLLVKLGVLPLDYNYVEGTMRVLNEQVAGYYDPRHKTLFIADWLAPEMQQMTMAHELAHALQDQHYELEKILSDSDRNGDALLARRAIVEGDAVGVMFDFVLSPMQASFQNLPNLKELYAQTLQQQLSSQSGTQQLQEAPAFIRDSLLFSYIYGANFMQAYRRQHEWSETQGLYDRLPESTEQIMHPERYLSERDEPTELDVPVENELMAWDIDYSDIFGEFQTFLALREFLPEAEAELAAAGWDGDRIRVLRDEEGRFALQWNTIWDSEEEAGQFRESYQKLIGFKYKLEPAVGSSPESTSWESEFDSIHLRQKGDRVLILEIEKVPVRRAD